MMVMAFYLAFCARWKVKLEISSYRGFEPAREDGEHQEPDRADQGTKQSDGS